MNKFDEVKNLPVQVFESLSLLHVGVEGEGLHIEELQDRPQSLQTVNAVHEDNGPARMYEEEVVEMEVL